MPLEPLPFRIGRSRSAHLVLGSPRVSKLHAEVFADGAGLAVRDLQSRNGTFVNGEPVFGVHPLHVGDVLHIAHRELRLVLAPRHDESVDDSTLADTSTGGQVTAFRTARDLYRIIRGRRVGAVFQAIVTLSEGAIIGFEALGRTTLSDVRYDPTTLFRIAHEQGRADELSRLMRAVALEEAPSLPVRGDRIFMNIHPDEMLRVDLIGELERASRALDGRRLVAEIHEAAIADARQMRRLRAELKVRDIELAYDDFGAGQSRLMELAEAPPDFLKLDMSLIRSIDESAGRQELVAAIVRVMNDQGVRVVAEGIETSDEHDVCRQLGCELGQGFLIRHPVSAGDLRDTWD